MTRFKNMEKSQHAAACRNTKLPARRTCKFDRNNAAKAVRLAAEAKRDIDAYNAHLDKFFKKYGNYGAYAYY